MRRLLDGTLEGTPAELAEYEKHRDGTATVSVPFVQSADHSPGCEITKAANGWWGILPPPCTCGKPSVFITTTFTAPPET